MSRRKPKLTTITFEVDAEDHALFTYAAKLTRKSLNRFLVDAAEAKANEVLKRLDDPAAPIPF
jgi:uncharacterized protein (DUF1778 family)